MPRPGSLYAVCSNAYARDTATTAAAAFMYVCMYVHMYKCMHVCMYKCMYVYMHV